MINLQIPLDIPDVEILRIEQNQSEAFIRVYEDLSG
jgi:hypothetical protein